MPLIVRLPRPVAGERNATVYLMISTYLAPRAEVDKVRAAHMEFLDGLEERGLVVAAGRQDPPVGGVILLDTATAEEATEVMAGDPYVRQGLASYVAIGWKPTRGALAGRNG
jgi:uncharacterized protein YciI